MTPSPKSHLTLSPREEWSEISSPSPKSFQAEHFRPKSWLFTKLNCINCFVNPMPYGLLNNPNLIGGRSALPSFMAIIGYFQKKIYQGFCLQCKGSESKSTALYIKNCSPETLLKNQQFWQNRKLLKIHYLEFRLFIQTSTTRSNKLRPNIF